MTNKEILTKAIQFAMDHGYECRFNNSIGGQWFVAGNMCILNDGTPPKEILYDHKFAKALWGEENYYRWAGDTLENPKQWQWHLQQMVIADDPIKYLGENL